MAILAITFCNPDGDPRNVHYIPIKAVDDLGEDFCDDLLELEFDYGTMDYSGDMDDQTGKWQHSYQSCEVEASREEDCLQAIRDILVKHDLLLDSTVKWMTE